MVTENYFPGELIIARIDGELKVVRIVSIPQKLEQDVEWKLEVPIMEVESFSRKKKYTIKYLQIMEKV